MTNDEQYVPSAGEVREEYVYGTQEVDMGGNVIVSFDEACARWDRFLARVRRDAEREAYTTARSVLAGEDTVEWARGAHGSSMSYPHAIGIMDDLIEDLDEEVSP